MTVIKNSELVYKKYLSKSGRDVRDGQLGMLKHVEEYLDSNITKGIEGCYVEAGTGTGKTVGYSLPAIVHALKHERKVVISTATIALQSQLIESDLPEIKEHTGLNFTYGLLKGRKNFVCDKKLSKQLGDEDAVELITMLESGEWEGDKENSGVSDERWNDLSSEGYECKGKKCEFYSKCSYYKHREESNAADVLVTNHAMLLTDLAIGGGVLLPSLEDTVLVLDESHKVPEIARERFAMVCAVEQRKAQLKGLRKATNILRENGEGNGAWLDRYNEGLVAYGNCLSESQESVRHLRELTVFEKGYAPDELRIISKALVENVQVLIGWTNKLLKHIVENSEGMKTKIGEKLDEIEVQLKKAVQDFEADCLIWKGFCVVDKATPLARWIEKDDKGERFNVAPVKATRALQRNLWADSYKVICCSATLRIDGDFKPFMEDMGANGVCYVAESPFDYQKQCTLEVGGMFNNPNDEGFYEEVGETLRKELSDHKGFGAMVLFTSRLKMNEVFQMLPEQLQETILMQCSKSKAKIVQAHKDRIASKQKSIIFGLESFSEGVDFKGEELTSLHIVKIAFDMPNDPISKTLAHWFKQQGRNAFNEIQVPKACRKMVQSCGRLIRTTEDVGRIRILDNRLVSKPYGKTILGTLPMSRENELKIDEGAIAVNG